MAEAARAQPAPRTWIVDLPGKLPGYTQLHERGNRYSARRLKLKHQEDVSIFLNAAHVPRLECVHLAYHHVRRDRRSDKSNLAAGAMKIIEDAMVELEILQNDGWNRVEGFAHTFEIAKRNGIVLTITEVIK